MQPKNPSQESVNQDTDTFPLPGSPNESSQSQPELASSEQSPHPAESVEAAPNKTERHLSDPEQDQPNTSSPSLPQPDDNSAIQPAAPPIKQSPSDDSATDDNTPLIADDVDVIEKEWVDKAKQIIEQTRNSPYRQEQEVERLQQSYLKKRYGKDVSSASQV